MNLEEKATEYSFTNWNSHEQRAVVDGFIKGYRECKNDIIEFLQANQKVTVKQVLEHLNQMK